MTILYFSNILNMFYSLCVYIRAGAVDSNRGFLCMQEGTGRLALRAERRGLDGC